jgi:hypothetical protein
MMAGSCLMILLGNSFDAMFTVAEMMLSIKISQHCMRNLYKPRKWSRLA